METNHLIIRKFISDDFIDFSSLIRDKMASKYAIYDQPFPTDDENLQNILLFFINSDEFFAVALKPEDKVIGFVSLNKVDDKTRNLGYCLHSMVQKKGYATEAVSALIQYAKEDLNLSQLICGTAKENTPSVSLLQKMGFIKTGENIGSFMNDEHGKPIEFIGYTYELKL